MNKQELWVDVWETAENKETLEAYRLGDIMNIGGWICKLIVSEYGFQCEQPYHSYKFKIIDYENKACPDERHQYYKFFLSYKFCPYCGKSIFLQCRSRTTAENKK